MQWLNEVTPYENMGDCDFLGCTEFEYDKNCPFKLEICFIDWCIITNG